MLKVNEMNKDNYQIGICNNCGFPLLECVCDNIKKCPKCGKWKKQLNLVTRINHMLMMF